MNNNSTPSGTVSQTGLRAASSPKPARVITQAEQFQFESHFDSAASSNAGFQAVESFETWDTADTSSTESSDVDRDGGNEVAPERETRVSEQRQHDSQSSSDDAQSGDESEPVALRQHPESMASPAFVHPFQLLGGFVSGNVLAAEAQAPQPRMAACWSQLSEGVNRLLINTDPHALNAPAAVLTLDSSLLPNTTLALVRVPEGWVLQVHSQSFEVKRALRVHASELEERFEKLNLGHLRVEALENAPDEQFI
jgi:hypothetical protein